MSVSLTELETAASDVIQILKTIPEFTSSRVAVIGGLALWKYVPRGRTTEDVDLIINLDSAPSGVKSRLLDLYSSTFVQRAQTFYYKSPSGRLVQVDICPDWQSPYLPPDSKVVSTIANGVVPYISPSDLIVFKINSCGLRAESLKSRRDALDAFVLLDQETISGPLQLSPAQRTTVETGLADVINYSGKDEKWWKDRLGF